MVEVDLVGVLTGIGWGLVGILTGLLGVVLYQKQVLKFQLNTLDVDDVAKRLKLKEQYIQDLEQEIEGYREEIDETKKEVAAWTGKYHQKGQIKKLDASKYDLSNPSDIGLVAEDLLTEFEKQASPEIKKILNNPMAKQWILDYANKHPEQTVEFVKSFLSKKSTAQQSSPIPDFDQSRAI